MRPRVKICCILDEEEAALAVRAGADCVGLVGPGLSGPEVRDEVTIARIARTLPPPVGGVLLTRERAPDALVAQVRRCAAPWVQICDEVSSEAWSALRANTPNVRILQVVHVDGPEAIARAAQTAPFVDAILLDSGTPSGPNPVYGGTGRTHDWSISRDIVRTCGRPVFLAGGLRPENVADAWATVRPFGLDLCSGVRVAGRLDADRLRDFFDAVSRLT
jgi:phosphoribosylanthranilate isomerase